MNPLNEYYGSTNHELYLGLLIWTTLIYLYAAWWDHNQHRVPNWIWFFAMIPIPSTFIIRDYAWDMVFIPIIIIMCYIFWVKEKWGAGDVKGIIILSFLIGSFPTVLIMGFAIISVMKNRNVPFMVPIVCSLGLYGLLYHVWRIVS